MRYLLPLLLLCSACAHNLPAAPTSGYFGRVHAGKPVYCADTGSDDGLTDAQCKLLEDSVVKINMAVGYELFHFGGKYKVGSVLPDKCEDMVIVGTSELPEPIAGVTIPRCMDSEYIKGTVILISPYAWAKHGDYVLLHELCHAAGLTHAEADGAYDSIMRPKDQPGAPAKLTPGDVASLRAGYVK